MYGVYGTHEHYTNILKKKLSFSRSEKKKGGTPIKIMKLFVQNSMYPTVRQKNYTGGWGGVGVIYSAFLRDSGYLLFITHFNCQTSAESSALTQS